MTLVITMTADIPGHIFPYPATHNVIINCLYVTLVQPAILALILFAGNKGQLRDSRQQPPNILYKARRRSVLPMSDNLLAMTNFVRLQIN